MGVPNLQRHKIFVLPTTHSFPARTLQKKGGNVSEYKPQDTFLVPPFQRKQRARLPCIFCLRRWRPADEALSLTRQRQVQFVVDKILRKISNTNRLKSNQYFTMSHLEILWISEKCSHLCSRKIPRKPVAPVRKTVLILVAAAVEKSFSKKMKIFCKEEKDIEFRQPAEIFCGESISGRTGTSRAKSVKASCL